MNFTGANNRALLLPDDTLGQRRTNAQRTELALLRDGNGMVRPESYPLYVFTLTKQVLTEPDCEARLRSDLRELALSQPREAVRFASELYRILGGKADEKNDQKPVGLNITLVGPASPSMANVVTPLAAGDTTIMDSPAGADAS